MAQLGLRRVGDLFEGGELPSFAALKEELEIHAGGFLAYGALRHAMLKLWGQAEPPPLHMMRYK